MTQTVFQFPDACVSCGSSSNRLENTFMVNPTQYTASSGAVTWRCHICGGRVCSACVVCKVGRPELGPQYAREIFGVTYCSHGCRKVNQTAAKLGHALVWDDELWESALP